MLAHLGTILAEGEHQLQRARGFELGIFRPMKIILTKLIGLGIPSRHQRARSRLDLPQAFFADEHSGVVQPEGEAIYSAKTFDFNAFQKHAAISSPSLMAQ